MEDYIGQIGPIPIRNAVLFLYIGRFLLGTDQNMYHRHLAKIKCSRFEILIFQILLVFQILSDIIEKPLEIAIWQKLQISDLKIGYF